MSTQQYMAHVRSELGADIDDETLTDCFTDIYLGLDTGVLGALARFRDEGHRLVALTNTNRSHHDRWWQMANSVPARDVSAQMRTILPRDRQGRVGMRVEFELA